MYISRVQIGNYKSFRETQPLEFFPGFNIVSGQNNAGKTSLLEAIAHVANAIDGFRSPPLTPDEVSGAVESKLIIQRISAALPKQMTRRAMSE